MLLLIHAPLYDVSFCSFIPFWIVWNFQSYYAEWIGRVGSYFLEIQSNVLPF